MLQSASLNVLEKRFTVVAPAFIQQIALGIFLREESKWFQRNDKNNIATMINGVQSSRYTLTMQIITSWNYWWHCHKNTDMTWICWWGELNVASKHGRCQKMLSFYISSGAIRNISTSATNAKDMYSDRWDYSKKTLSPTLTCDFLDAVFQGDKTFNVDL